MRRYLRSGALAALLTAAGLPAAAQDGFPAIYRVAGGDALRVHAEPDEMSASLGELLPGAAGIEVVAQSQDGHWGLVNLGEGAGWVAMPFLEREGHPSWRSLRGNVACYGTEPFWNLDFAGDGASAVLSDPDAIETRLPVAATAGTAGFPGPPLGIALGEAGDGGFAVIRPEVCSDGMSDRAFGLAIDLFRRVEDGLRGYSGCCTVAAD
jgi:uncharacterized membrane protein